MNSKNLIRRNDTILPSSYLWVAAALSVILILGTFLSAPRVGASEDPIQRGIDADAARYQALGASYLARAEAGRLRGLDAASARWAALSTSYAHGSAEQPYTDVSLFYVERLRAQIRESSAAAAAAQLPYTDVSKFYVERLRAQIREGSAVADNSALADNPELSFARRSYSAAANLLAANPELSLARRSYSPSLGVCGPDDTQLAANPELGFFRQVRGC